jgi:hypothetical protein
MSLPAPAPVQEYDWSLDELDLEPTADELARIAIAHERRQQRVVPMCKARPSCWQRHSKHTCTKCGDDDSDHVIRNCPQ